MTSNRNENRFYDTNHPEFNTYLHPEIPGYDFADTGKN